MVVKIGITGANGRVGTVLRRAFSLVPEFQLRLFTFDPPQGAVFETEAIPDHFEKKVVDFSKKEQVDGAFEGLDVVIHLAALVDVTPYGENWEKMWANNFEATWNVFREVQRAQVKRIVFASSNHVQNGALIKDPKNTETLDLQKVPKGGLLLNDPPYPDSLYAVAKLFGEDLGKLFALQSGIEVVSLRIGWVLHYKSDDPSSLKGTSSETYMRAMYLSHRDCVQYFVQSISVPIKSDNGIPYMMAYACSRNKTAIWNMEETFQKLEFVPEDDSEKFFG